MPGKGEGNSLTTTDAEFYVLLKIKRDADGSVESREFVQARKTKPEPGLLRTGPDQCWIKVSAFVPSSIFFGTKKVGHEPIGLWGAPVIPGPSELATAAD